MTEKIAKEAIARLGATRSPEPPPEATPDHPRAQAKRESDDLTDLLLWCVRFADLAAGVGIVVEGHDPADVLFAYNRRYENKHDLSLGDLVEHAREALAARAVSAPEDEEVERVARAICGVWSGEPEGSLAWQECFNFNQVTLRNSARAAIAALAASSPRDYRAGLLRAAEIAKGNEWRPFWDGQGVNLAVAAAIRTEASATEPPRDDGWRRVPIEPTLEMLRAGYDVLAKIYPPEENDGQAIGQHVVWEAMLGALPPAPEPSHD